MLSDLSIYINLELLQQQFFKSQIPTNCVTRNILILNEQFRYFLLMWQPTFVKNNKNENKKVMMLLYSNVI